MRKAGGACGCLSNGVVRRATLETRVEVFMGVMVYVVSGHLLLSQTLASQLQERPASGLLLFGECRNRVQRAVDACCPMGHSCYSYIANFEIVEHASSQVCRGVYLSEFL